MAAGHRAPVAASPCPCGSGRDCADCCGRWHEGAPAPDPESLMRARYSAWVLGLDDYLLSTWHPSTRPDRLSPPGPVPIRWLGLEVREVSPLAVDADGVARGAVRFVARCRIGGRGQRMHERSRFVREDGRWYYLDGDDQA